MNDKLNSIYGTNYEISDIMGAKSFGGSDTVGAGLFGSSDTVGARPSVSSANKLLENTNLRSNIDKQR